MAGKNLNEAGAIIMKLPDGSMQEFNSGKEAQQWMIDNGYPEYMWKEDNSEQESVDNKETTQNNRSLFGSPQFQDVFGTGNPIWGNSRLNLHTRPMYGGKYFDETQTYRSFRDANDTVSKSLIHTFLTPSALGISGAFQRALPSITKEFATELPTIAKVAGTSFLAGAGHGLVNSITSDLTRSPENNYQGYTFPQWAAKYSVDPNAELVAEILHPGSVFGGAAAGPLAKIGESAIMNQTYNVPFLTNNKTLRSGFGQILDIFGLGSGNQSIRYRDGIRDYLGNVLSKYSTIASKPTTYSGNQLELARKRVLDNLEQYGIKDTDYVSWTTQADNPNLLQLSKSIGFEIPSYNKTPYSIQQVTVTMPARTYLEHISPISGIEASFRPSSATIFHQNHGYIGDIQKLYPEFADAHEFSHAIDWVLHNKTMTIPQTNGVNVQLNNSFLKNIYKETISNPGINIQRASVPEINVPGLNYNRLKQDISTQEYHRNPTELKARYEQIRNWLGISDERPLTLTEWDQAKRYYTSSVGDNNMQEFFKLVENPEEFINWASKRYSTNYNGTVSRAIITKLSRRDTPTQGSFYFPYKVSHEDELPGFLEMIQEQAKGKAPISKTTGLTSYAMPKGRQITPSERPNSFNGLRTTFRRQDPETITAGDQAYGLAHNLTGYDASVYSGILKNTNIVNYNYEEAARALMYDVKAQLYKKLAQEKGGALTAEEFADALWDLKISDFQKAFRRAHGGIYRKDIPLTFDIDNLTTDDVTKIINQLTQYKNGGKFYKKSTKFNK